MRRPLGKLKFEQDQGPLSRNGESESVIEIEIGLTAAELWHSDPDLIGIQVSISKTVRQKFFNLENRASGPHFSRL